MHQPTITHDSFRPIGLSIPLFVWIQMFYPSAQQTEPMDDGSFRKGISLQESVSEKIAYRDTSFFEGEEKDSEWDHIGYSM